MAVKIITVDVEAYELLARRKRPGMSFSRVIKVHLGPRKTARDLLATTKANPLGPKTLDALDDLIRARNLAPARAPRRQPRSFFPDPGQRRDDARRLGEVLGSDVGLPARLGPAR